jgi:hypothetical protein
MFDDDIKEEEIFQSQPKNKYDLRPKPGGPKQMCPLRIKIISSSQERSKKIYIKKH